MSIPHASDQPSLLSLEPVNKENWRGVAQLKVTPEQQTFVAEPCYYLALCCYGGIWQPLAIMLDRDVIGMCMWGIDPEDGSCWLGGVLIDQSHQGRGYGKAALQTALNMLAEQHGHRNFALSYNPTNQVAKKLYETLGFRETSEQVDDEVVARFVYAQ